MQGFTRDITGTIKVKGLPFKNSTKVYKLQTRTQEGQFKKKKKKMEFRF